MSAPERDVERTALDVRVEAEDRAGRPPAVVEGADVIAHREVIDRARRAPIDRPYDHPARQVEAREVAVEVLVEAVDRSGDQWDPHAYVGSVAAGIVRALRDLGALR